MLACPRDEAVRRWVNYNAAVGEHPSTNVFTPSTVSDPHCSTQAMRECVYTNNCIYCRQIDRDERHIFLSFLHEESI